jgi:anti-anti-sigma factor
MTMLPHEARSSAFPLSWSSAALGGGTVLVTLVGDLDGNTAPGLRDHLEWQLAGGCTRLVLDAGAVAFADVAAYELLRQVGQRAAERGCVVVLADPGSHLLRFVALLGAPAGITVDQW